MSFTSHFDCPICGQSEKEIPFYGFSYCNHPICGLCAIKLQKFSKDGKSDYDYSKCVICKQEISKIIIASSVKQYEDFDEMELLCDNKYALLFESTSAQKFYNNIMQIICPVCKTSHHDLGGLIKHMEEHKKRYCELCIEFNKCLHFELEIYTDNDYHNHRIKTHPKCKFCEIRFYDDSQLIKHVKDMHFVCDICHRNKGPTAYSTQNELLKHYIQDHFVCEICRASNNINVFESEYNLKTHKVSAHNYSLVGEGLVNVGFGDRDNMRYGARRRARDQDEGFFVEPVTVEIPQTIPTMNSEQEFPRLCSSEVAANHQLGSQSLTLDENDARTAFNSWSGAPRDAEKSSRKPAGSPQPPIPISKQEKMSDNFAISVKKSAGILNSKDFPSLSSNGGAGERSSRPGAHMDVSRAVKTKSNLVSSQSNSPFTTRNESDFPCLSSRPQHAPAPAQHGSSWTAAVKPGTTHKTTVTKANKPTSSHNNGCPDNLNKSSTATVLEENNESIQPPAERPKVSVMSEEEFQFATGQAKQPTATNRHQAVPNEQDFPSLGRAVPSGAGLSGWGKSGVSSSGSVSIKSTVQNGTKQDQFVLDSKSDFPGLPASQTRPARQSAGRKGKAGFASVAGASSRSGRPQMFSMAAPSKPVAVAPAPPRMELACAFEHVAPKQPASLRGIDYIPSVAPAKDPLVVVDSKQFSIMKQAKERQSSSSSGGGQFSLGNACTDEFPSMQLPTAALSSCNHFDAFSDNVGDGLAAVSSKKENVRIAPKLTSEAEFPSLGAPKSKQEMKKNRLVAAEVPQSVEPQPTERKAQPRAPVVSLMDVAMSVAKKNYFSFPDNNERNQSMCESLYENLSNDMATQFLQLSNLYRNRKLSVQDYLESLQTDFVENLDFIARMLPQMCVLLPDIPLQRSLRSTMPKAWSKELRECSKCDQVLLTSDVALHNQLAH